MNELQFPVFVTDLFGAFGITDPAQMLIVVLSSILGVLIILIILVAFLGRPSKDSGSFNQMKVDTSAKTNMPELEPLISGNRQPDSDDASAALKADNLKHGSGVAEQVEDFQIFKRPKKKGRLAGQLELSSSQGEQMTTAEHLRLIEKEMVRLRDLYRGGHITRDMYVDETRTLYHQARGLSSVS